MNKVVIIGIYTILPGTNRIKSYSEVTNDSVLLKVIGKEQLKSLLSKFPKKENILWIGENWLSRIWGLSGISYDNLKLPSSSVINEIKQHCNKIEVLLTISE
jgi:hypothetical protein